MSKIVYVDNAATTQVSESVLESMVPFFVENYGNPSSVYSLGRKTRDEINKSREKVAKSLNALPQEIYFTSCATEANNWALRGALKVLEKKGKNHLITTVIEHHAILHTAEQLEKEGYKVTYLPVDQLGIVNLEELKKAITPETALVSIMFANNEIGTIQPIEQISKICKDAGVLFHTDAVQAIGNIKLDVKELNLDMLSLSGHKFHAPKGIGVLYIKKGVRIDNILYGGAQEKSKRPGTENVANIVGIGTAIEEITSKTNDRTAYIQKLADKLKTGLLKIERSRLNGDPVNRLSGNVNISFEGVEGEALLLMLDAKGICASSGSACTSGSLDPSHVLMAIGLEHIIAHGSLRISFSEYNTMEDVDYILESLPPVIALLRSMSPVWEEIINSDEYKNNK
ncbi:MAG: cysteine desulfurase NifS [Oscillospiraceae bacterium]